MTTTALPSPPTELLSSPANAGIETLHLSISQTLESGSSQNINLLENGDIGVIRRKGQPNRTRSPVTASAAPSSSR